MVSPCGLMNIKNIQKKLLNGWHLFTVQLIYRPIIRNLIQENKRRLPFCKVQCHVGKQQQRGKNFKLQLFSCTVWYSGVDRYTRTLKHQSHTLSSGEKNKPLNLCKISQPRSFKVITQPRGRPNHESFCCLQRWRIYIFTFSHLLILKGLSHEIDFKNFEKNLQNLT